MYTLHVPVRIMDVPVMNNTKYISYQYIGCITITQDNITTMLNLIYNDTNIIYLDTDSVMNMMKNRGCHQKYVIDYLDHLLGYIQSEQSIHNLFIITTLSIYFSNKTIDIKMDNILFNDDKPIDTAIYDSIYHQYLKYIYVQYKKVVNKIINTKKL